MIGLMRQSGYGAAPVTTEDIDSYLRAHPDLVESWVAYSDDQRCTPAFYLAYREGSDPPGEWRVGYRYSSQEAATEERFPDRVSACAHFVKMEAEQLLMLGGGTST